MSLGIGCGKRRAKLYRPGVSWWMIGSGVVDAASKTIVGARLKRSGMRWSQDGAQHVLNLRTRSKSGEWSSFWSGYLELRNAA